MRSDLRAAALKTGQQDLLESSQKALEKLAGKMNRGYFHGYLPRSMLHQALKSDVPPGSRKKGSKRGKVDLAEQMEIAQKVLVGSQFYYEVAKEHRVSISRVSGIVFKVKKDRLAVEALFQKQADQRQ